MLPAGMIFWITSFFMMFCIDHHIFQKNYVVAITRSNAEDTPRTAELKRNNLGKAVAICGYKISPQITQMATAKQYFSFTCP